MLEKTDRAGLRANPVSFGPPHPDVVVISVNFTDAAITFWLTNLYNAPARYTRRNEAVDLLMNHFPDRQAAITAGDFNLYNEA